MLNPYFVNPFVDILLIDAYVLSIPEDSLSTFIYILVYKIMEFQILSQIPSLSLTINVKVKMNKILDNS